MVYQVREEQHWNKEWPDARFLNIIQYTDGIITASHCRTIAIFDRDVAN